MKYWSSSRVGAVPQASESQNASRKKESGGGSRFQRKQGITMEDLKKQTALRLAHEQSHQNKSRGPSSGSSGGSNDSRNSRSFSNDSSPQKNLGNVSDPSAVAVVTSAASPSPTVFGNASGLGLVRHGSSPAPGTVRDPLESLSFPYSTTASGFSSARGGVAHPAGNPESSVLPPGAYDHQYRPPSSLEQSQLSSAPKRMYNATELSSSSSLSSSSPARNNNSSHVSSVDASAAAPKHRNKKSSKLPHGLTVQELKEMTKARLQAEAAASDRTSSGASAAVTTTPAAPPVRGGDPALLMPAVSVGGGQHHHQQLLQPRDRAWSSHDSRSEAWETGSVSTVASEYLGSEAAYGIGSYGGGPEDPSPSPYGQPLPPIGASGVGTSQPGFGPPVHNFSDLPPSEFVTFQGGTTHPAAYHPYEASHGGGYANRRRAATLSPRGGLSYLDERREVFPDREAMPTLPSFSSLSGHGHFAPRTPSRNGGGYGVGADRFVNGAQPPYRMASSPLDVNRSMEFNRPRTSSATSLPPISHTSDEFSLDPSSFRRVPSGLGSLALRDGAPSPSVTGLADAFQEPASFVVSPPPGLSGMDLLRPRLPTVSNFGLPSSHGLSHDGYLDAPSSAPLAAQDPRGRAATWGGATSLDSLFGPGLIGGGGASAMTNGSIAADLSREREQQKAQDSLCDDLESILKLSVVPDPLLVPGESQLFPPPGL